MLEAAVVENHVHHHLQTLLVRIRNKLTIVIVRSEARVNTIVVGRSVSVICTALAVVGRVVLKHRREPQRRDAKLVEVVEVLAYAFEVAAVTQRRLLAVHGVSVQALHFKILSARRKSVGHEHVQHVGVGEAHVVFALHVARLQLVLHVCLALARTEQQVHCARLSILHVHVHQQIVRRVETHERVDAHARIVGRHLSSAHVLAVNHQLHLRILHAYEPVCRFDAVYLLCCIHRKR